MIIDVEDYTVSEPIEEKKPLFVKYLARSPKEDPVLAAYLTSSALSFAAAFGIGFARSRGLEVSSQLESIATGVTSAATLASGTLWFSQARKDRLDLGLMAGSGSAYFANFFGTLYGSGASQIVDFISSRF